MSNSPYICVKASLQCQNMVGLCEPHEATCGCILAIGFVQTSQYYQSQTDTLFSELRTGTVMNK